jgi:hypothetical protein
MKKIYLMIVLSFSISSQSLMISDSYYNSKNKCVYLEKTRKIKIYSLKPCPITAPDNEIISLNRYSPVLGKMSGELRCKVKPSGNDFLIGECQ